MFQQSRDVVGDKTEFNQESELEFSGTLKVHLRLNCNGDYIHRFRENGKAARVSVHISLL